MRTTDSVGNELILSPELIASAHNVVVELFQQEISVRSVIRISDILLNQSQSILDEVERVRKPEYACKKGCSWCCRGVYVSATPLEVLYLTAYIQTNFSLEDIEALKARTAVSQERRLGLTSDEQEALRDPCPLLVDDSCSVYPARPLPCRGWISRDVTPCRSNYENPGLPPEPVPFYKPFKEIVGAVRAGLQSGLDETPLQNDDLQLIGALHIALNTPDICERWLSGERVFPDETLQKD